MSNYKPVLERQMKEFNDDYRILNKLHPELSKDKKVNICISKMFHDREETKGKVTDQCFAQYMSEVSAVMSYVGKSVATFNHYYIPDWSLVEWMMETPVDESSRSFFISELENLAYDVEEEKLKLKIYGVYSKKQSFTILYSESKCEGDIRHFINIISNDMNCSIDLEDLDFNKIYDNGIKVTKEEVDNTTQMRYFRLSMNFLFYLKAFPEYVIDGTPADEKRNPAAHTVKISDKIIDKSEHFVTPHFRSGHFRHLTSDYFKNKKGSVVFIKSTMVKGKAKTVLNKGV